MTFREMAFRDELSASRRDERSIFRALLDNQSPVMKFWFAIMVLNLLMFLFILQ